MQSFFKQWCRALALVVAATGLVPAHALTMDELSAAFPKNRVVEQCAFIFAHEGVNFVALANDAKEVGIILLLPVKGSHYQKVEELAERFRKLIPDGEKEFRVEPFTYRGKTSQALINRESLAQETSRRNRWMGIPLYQCLAYGLAKANGRIAGVSDDSIVMEVSNEVFGKMRVTVYLLSFGDVEIVDVVPRKRTKKSTENAEALSSEFDFSYRYAVDEDDVKDLKRDYLINRPLVYGRFNVGSYYSSLPCYVAAEGSAFRIGTARAFRELRSRKDMQPLAYSGEDCAWPETWPADARTKGTAASAAGRSAMGSVQNPAQATAAPTAPGSQAQAGQQPGPPAQSSRTDQKASPASTSDMTVIFYNPATALEAYLEALRHL